MGRPSVAERNLELWFSWVQSPHILVACADGAVLIPRELLRRRSPWFGRTIDELERGEERERIYLEDVEFPTLKSFHRWCMNENPSIPDGVGPPALLDLSMFAAKYQVFALEHQTVDKFSKNFQDHSGRNAWVAQADMVARVYRECGPSACVRRVFEDGLNSLSPQQLLDDWKEWSQVAGPDGGELSLALLRAMAESAVRLSNNRSRLAYYHSTASRLQEPCRFHDHARQGLALANTEGGFGGFSKTECPFRQMECFPDRVVMAEDLSAVDDTEAAPCGEPETTEGEAVAVGETSRAASVVLDDPPAAADPDPEPEPEPEPEECIDPWALTTRSKKVGKGKKEKKKALLIFDEEAPPEAAVVAEEEATESLDDLPAAEEISALDDAPPAEAYETPDDVVIVAPPTDANDPPAEDEWALAKKSKKERKEARKKRRPTWEEDETAAIGTVN